MAKTLTATKASPFAAYGDDSNCLKCCAEWMFQRAKLQAAYAESKLKGDTAITDAQTSAAIGRMLEIEVYHLRDWLPHTMQGVKALVEIATALLDKVEGADIGDVDIAMASALPLLRNVSKALSRENGARWLNDWRADCH